MRPTNTYYVANDPKKHATDVADPGGLASLSHRISPAQFNRDWADVVRDIRSRPPMSARRVRGPLEFAWSDRTWPTE